MDGVLETQWGGKNLSPSHTATYTWQNLDLDKTVSKLYSLSTTKICITFPALSGCYDHFLSPLFDTVMKNCLTIAQYLGLPCSSAGKESACNAEDLDSIPELGRSPGEGKGFPVQYSGLENSLDSIVYGSQRVGHDWVNFISYHNKIFVKIIMITRHFHAYYFCRSRPMR